jgi:GT2 family glycosyltransferase/glycosyltransferase involved in cell wall biosynthesis
MAAPGHLMRVLLIVHGFPPSGTGGAELYTQRLARELQACGHVVAVFTREATQHRPEYFIRDELRDGIQIRWVNNTFREARRFEDTYANAPISARLDAFVREFRPDVAHVHHLTCLSSTVLDTLAANGVPSILHLHDYWMLCHRGQLLDSSLQRCSGPAPDGCARCVGREGAAPALAYRAGGWLRVVQRSAPGLWPASLDRGARRLVAATGGDVRARERSRRRLAHMRARFEHVAIAVAPSAHVKARFAAAGFPADRIVVSEYGVDGARVPRAGVAGPVRIGFLGSLMASKAPHLLAEAVEQLGPDGFDVSYYGAPAPYHGDTRYADTIVARLERSGARVHGPLPHDQVGPRLSELDVLVFPSIWEETSGIGAREALAAGVPVVAARIGGVPEFVHHEVNGLLFEPGDARDLARQLGRLRDDRALLRRLAAGITPVRPFADDLRATIARYDEARARKVTPSKRRRVAAVVLNYRTPVETATAVAWLRMADPPLHAIVAVDNGDGRELGDALGAFQSVQLVATGGNLGFAGGANAGIRVALAGDADAVLLVNSDVAIASTATATLADALEGTVGIAGPIVRNRAYPDLFMTAGIDFDHRTGRMRARTTVPDGDEPGPSAVSGCAMLIDRRVFDRIGLLADPYFFGFEDIEFCERARAAGFDIAVVPAATAYHAGSRTMGVSPDRLYYGTRNHLRLAAATPARSRLHAALRRLAIVGYSVAHATTARGASVGHRLRAVADGVADYRRGRGGSRHRQYSG